MSRTVRLSIVLVLNVTLVTALVAVGVAAHSLGVVAAGADYLGDAAAIAVSLLAIRLAKSQGTPEGGVRFPRVTTIAAGVNAGWLLVLSAGVAIGGVTRLLTGTPEVHAVPVVVVSAGAALVMVVGVMILDGEADEDDGADAGEAFTMRAVVLDTAADAAAATGVAVTGVVILAAHGMFWLDPAVALVIAAVVAGHAAVLLAEVAGALRHARHPQ